MTKTEYLNGLKKALYTLSQDEQNEALDYYSSYLDEAENVEEAMKKLGTPEELAQTIKDKIAGVPVKASSKTEKEDDGFYSGYDASGWNKLIRYTVKKDEVKNWDFNCGVSQVVIVPTPESTDSYIIECKNVDTIDLTCEVSKHGTLIINNKLVVNKFRGKEAPRILIKIPQVVKLNRLKLNMGAGSLELRDSKVFCEEGFVCVSAGRLVVDSVFGGKMELRCGAGELNYSGSLTKESEINCGLGNVEVDLKGKIETYSYNATVGLGTFKFNDQKKNGVGSQRSDIRKENNITAKVGLGSISIKIDEK